MTHRNLTTEQMAALEAMIDATSLESVLVALGSIAGDKAQHILDNWQDAATAETWNKAAMTTLAASGRVRV